MRYCGKNLKVKNGIARFLFIHFDEIKIENAMAIFLLFADYIDLQNHLFVIENCEIDY